MKSQTRFSAVLGIFLLLALVGANIGGGATATFAQGGTTEPTAAATIAATPELSVKAGTLPAEITLTLAGFAVPREAYAEIIPLFKQYWLDKTGQTVNFKESYQASGAQSRAVVGGFNADVVALSLEADVARIAKANLITYDWKNTPYNGTVSASVAVLAVREGNPKGIKDWNDIAKDGVEVVTPNPATSGGAQWNLLAAFGAAKRGKIAGVDPSEDSALKFLGSILKNVVALDADGRSSFLTFEKGIGDVAITYENEALAGLAAGDKIEIIYPPSTIWIENPGAYVDVYAKKNNTLPAAKAFVDFLLTVDAQKVFAAHGFRPLPPELLKDPELAKKFPPITDLFTYKEFGDWSTISKDLFGDSGKISKLLTDIKGK